MNRSHQFEICRAAYQFAREQGSPPVLATKLSPDFIVLETKDGKVRMEGLRPYYDGCCMWAMKLKCAEKWIGENKKQTPIAESLPFECCGNYAVGT